jgi:hypothetical protein
MGFLTFAWDGMQSESPSGPPVEGGSGGFNFVRGGKRTVHGVQQTADKTACAVVRSLAGITHAAQNKRAADRVCG